MVFDGGAGVNILCLERLAGSDVLYNGMVYARENLWGILAESR